MWGRLIAAQSGVDGRKRFIPTRVGQIINSGYIRVYYIRFIPTRVGQIKAVLEYTVMRFGSSPRVWGRLQQMYLTLYSKRGSSPRVWGRCFFQCRSVAYSVRFIPTRVGQMLSGENNSGSVTRFIPTRVGQMFTWIVPSAVR